MPIEEKLYDIFGGNVGQNQALSELSNWKIGGRIRYVVRPQNINQLRSLLHALKETRFPYLVIGRGSNILFTDEDVEAVLIILEGEFCDIEICPENGNVIVGAAVWMPRLVRKIGSAGLGGAEHLIGIPGSVGGVTAMNGGSNRRSISENISEITSIDLDGNIIRRSVGECEFSYRASCYQSNREIILNVSLSFMPGLRPLDIKKEMRLILKSRRNKFPLGLPNCGSVFMADPLKYTDVGPPGKILDELGMKGMKVGGASISATHANFIVNNGGAKAKDVLELVRLAKSSILSRYPDYKLYSEIKYCNSSAELVSLHCVEI